MTPSTFLFPSRPLKHDRRKRPAIATPTQPGARRLRLEPLEDRRMLNIGDLLYTLNPIVAPQPGSEFGYAVAADGNLTVVGAPGASLRIPFPLTFPGVGIAYVFNSTTGAGYYYRVEGSVPVNVYASGNANDTCKFYDSSGADTFTASPGLASMSGPGYATRTAHGFTKEFGYGSFVYGQTGQGDTAKLYDGPGNDTWTAYGHWNYSEMSGPGYYIHTQGFEMQRAYATAGGTGDVAHLKDTPEHDVFWATGGVDQGSGTLISITTLTAPSMSWRPTALRTRTPTRPPAEASSTRPTSSTTLPATTQRCSAGGVIRAT